MNLKDIDGGTCVGRSVNDKSDNLSVTDRAMKLTRSMRLNNNVLVAEEALAALRLLTL